MHDISFSIQLFLTATFAVEYVEKKLKKIGLDRNEFLYIIVAKYFPSVSQSTIAKKLNVNRSTVSRIISKLIKKDYCYRENSENNRDFNVYLTNKGQETCTDIEKVISEFEDKYLNTLGNTKDFTNTFWDFFTKIREAQFGIKK
ncbi:MarR family transcriptional regulator [Spiroplasma chinense]|uniref:MarR family transcriptional regulator n=1 Tax=Spiroplasma chinense TaxID=216932 RepID=A0A5B9Y507_9MOLU|nr:MarR family transcriptional regulator [Spiroplasma chinense]QEH61769.1 MarR family transcriptional regulator [Spiroplasma chinense]